MTSSPPPQFGVLQEEEGCTRNCIQELQATVLELLLQDFLEWGAALLCPPLPC